MAQETVIIQVDKNSKAIKAVETLNERMLPTNLQVWMETAMQPILEKRARNRFYEEGDDATGPWPALSEATVQIREDLGYGGAHPINIRTGSLEDYIVNSNVAVYQGVEEVTGNYPNPNDVDTETLVKVFAAQHGGMTEAGQPFPARPVAALSETDAGEIIGSLAAFLTEGLAVI